MHAQLLHSICICHNTGCKCILSERSTGLTPSQGSIHPTLPSTLVQHQCIHHQKASIPSWSCNIACCDARLATLVLTCISHYAEITPATDALQLLERTFTFPGHAGLPKATFDAWQKLADALSGCAQLGRRHQLLLNPITHALKSDKRPAVHQVACFGRTSAELLRSLHT